MLTEREVYEIVISNIEEEVENSEVERNFIIEPQNIQASKLYHKEAFDLKKNCLIFKNRNILKNLMSIGSIMQENKKILIIYNESI